MSVQEFIAHYRITSTLGEGGMGKVYRATDTKLNREVAIKVLPESFAENPDRMARFRREAQVLASLNHPNVAAIYGVEENALVMELVEGENLKGPLPIKTAIDYARQIAAGLEAAHEKGIVHRDLKPANIKVTRDGIVKLLDFGLASKTSGKDVADATVTMSLTQPGMMLGTAAYMAPEQAAGNAVDKRADIWAFGVVLFEMLTGNPLFEGETPAHTLANVMAKEFDLNAIAPKLRPLLRRCLKRDPRERLRDIGDAGLILDDLDDGPGVKPAPRWLPLIATALVVACAIATTMWWFRAKPVDTVAARFVLTLPEGFVESHATNSPQAVPSPNGRHLAFVAQEANTNKNYLWVRPLGSLSAQRLDQSEGANFPFWSPDGRFIGFFADQKVKKIAVSGEFLQVVCDANGSGDGGAWNESGTIIFAPSAQDGPLMIVPAAGGQATPVTTLDTNRTEIHHSWPQFLPDGKRFIYLATSGDAENNGIYVQELGTPKRDLILKTSTRAALAPTGHLLFAREGMLYAQRLDFRDAKLAGDPIPVADEIGTNPTNGRAAFAVSQNAGVLVYHQQGTKVRQLTWYNRAGKRLGTVGEPGKYTVIRLSPDETQVALLIKVNQFDLETWIMDLERGIFTRKTADMRQPRFFGPVWSPDSRRIVVNLERGALREMIVDSGAMKAISPGINSIFAHDWSPDGKFLLCADNPPKRISLLPLSPERGGSAEQKLTRVVSSRYPRYGLRLSPDGRWVAFDSDESGGFELYVASFPSFADMRRVSENGADWPIWRKDGKELFFSTPTGVVMAAEVNAGSNLKVGVPQPLFQMNISDLGQFAVTGDGKRFLVNEVIEQPADVGTTVVLNWAAEMTQ
jgi:Tol biopolymer transport system component/predicted Ser/Thr protein kinase